MLRRLSSNCGIDKDAFSFFLSLSKLIAARRFQISSRAVASQRFNENLDIALVMIRNTKMYVCVSINKYVFIHVQF